MNKPFDVLLKNVCHLNLFCKSCDYKRDINSNTPLFLLYNTLGKKFYVVY